jgi:hypothetical protein
MYCEQGRGMPIFTPSMTFPGKFDITMTLSAISHAQLQASGEVVRVRVLEPLEINLGIRQLGSLLYGDDHDLEWDLDVLSA